MIGGHPAFQVPEEDHLIIRWYLIKKEKKREIIRRSFTIWRPMTRDIRWRKRPAAKLKDGQVPVTKGFFDQILTYMFDGAQISSVGLLVDETPYVTIDCGDFPYLGVWTIEATHPFMPGAMVRPVRSRRIQGRIKRPAGHPEAGSLGNLGEKLQHPDRIEPRS